MDKQKTAIVTVRSYSDNQGGSIAPSKMSDDHSFGATAKLIRGIQLGAASAGIRQRERDDLALIQLADGTHTAAVFTRNAFYAAPIAIARDHIGQASPRYLLINSGNANAGTGQPGIDDALATCEMVARQTDCEPNEILPFSTGVIGERLPVESFREALPKAFESLSPLGWEAVARAIMTTDTIPKFCSKRIVLDGQVISITGIAKGAGMIRPDMATMLAFVGTDAFVEQGLLDRCLRVAVDQSFNRITVDGDTSTNDACVLMATGANRDPTIERLGESYAALEQAVTEVCIFLAQAIVRDGEGATKFIQIAVEGGKTEQECLLVAYALAHSPLVKTAFFASDPNWGRLLAAIGRAGVPGLDIQGVSVWLEDVCVFSKGEPPTDYVEVAGKKVMANKEITVRVDLGRGEGRQATVWTCDLSHDYVRINAEYRT